ncbi:MAG TPA: right-handed parallel beta-helix repeat-containing protein, partial [bacterium]|nr:right-handed parallel beta-helix repeat-containing protein [bacterium]
MHLFFCNILSAIELRIDLSTYDGSAASPWNVIPLANANSLNSNLIDYLTGNVTSVSLIGSGWNGGWYGSASPSWNATGASDRLYCSSGSASWTFSNLGTSNYSVEIASEGDGSYTYFTVNSLQASYSNLGNTVYPWYQNNPVNDWLIWSSVTPISGQITINCSLQSGSYLNMNMIRLVELPTPPTVTTQAVSNITTTTATGNGNITSLGTSNPTQHGHCWNTAPNPTIANSKTTLGAKSSTGTFTSSITGLTAGTLYYVRAYATNSVGTAYGAEVSFITVPNAPTANVATNINTSSITANWSASSGATGYYLDVSTASDFSSFVTGYNNLNVGNVTTYNITGLTPYTTYYYRVRAYNTSGTSSNSNTISDTSLYNGPIFYVNDLSLTNDIYTSKAGSNTINIGNQEYPFLTITHALSRAYSGCTIYVDAGTYTETVVITQNGISLIGADSSLTIIDPPGDTTITTLWGIYADTQTNLTIKNLRVTDAYYGIYMLNVDSSVFDNITVDYCGGGNSGSFYLLNSDSNIVRNCNLSSNWNRGLYLNYSHNNLVYNNLFAQSINNAGITFAYSNSNTLNNNYSLNNNGFGIYVTNCSGSIITNNIISENNSNGLYINYSSNDIITDNISSNNKMAGILIGYSNGCQVMRNVASNSSDTVNGIGIRILASSNLIFTQNTVDSNASYGFYIAGASSNCTFVMNNWISSPTNPDSAVYIAGDTVFNFTNNYWSTTDSNVISSKIIGNGVNYSSFRTTVIDTSLNADSIAPAAPSFISADTSFAKQIRLRWTKPALDENGGV